MASNLAPSRTTSYPSWQPGTAGYTGALASDYQAGLITQDQFRQLSVAPYTTTTVAEPSAWESFWGGLSSTANILFSGYEKYQLMENQDAMLKLQIEQQRQMMVAGMMGEGVTPSYGGINMYTVLMFAGIGILAMVLLKK